jgi:thiamine biosynthesis lipoprotein
MTNDFSWRPSRRDVLFVSIAGFATALPFARRRPLTLVRRNVPVMGTIARFVVAHHDAPAAEAAIAAGIEQLRYVDLTMSRFKSASDVGRANLKAHAAPVEVSQDTWDVLAAGLRWAHDTGGVFDPCLGSAILLWDVNQRREPPSDAEVRRFADRRWYGALELAHRRERPVVRFHDSDLKIDLGGIAKGYAVDRAARALREHGIEHALVGAAGDLYAIGRSPSGEPWQVGIQSPSEREALAGVLRIENQAVSTSGDYQQYFEYGHRRYHHLLDTATAAPLVTERRSVTVIADTCLAADAGATFAFCSGTPAVHAILARHDARVAHTV